MALQVRLRHALGERLLELPDRGVADPLVVGRARDADVQVPSVRVLPQHCVLFVHEGQWVIQGTAGVTKLNGQPISGPTGLNIGDRIEIGNDASPPSLDVDPVGVSQGRKGPARAGNSSVSHVLAPTVMPARSGPVPMPMSPAVAPPQPVYPPPVQAAPLTEPCSGSDADPDQIGWSPQQAPHLTGTSYSIRKTTKSSGASAGFAIVFAVVVLGGAAALTYRHIHQPIAPPPVPHATTQPPIVEDDTPRLHSNLFDGRGEAISAGRASTEPSDAPDPGRLVQADATWDDVLARHYEVTRQGPAIIAFDEYRRLHPGKFDRELDRYTDDAINWIWWQRIAQLCTERDRLIDQIRKKKQDIRSQPPGPFHERLVKEQADLDAQLDKVRQILTIEMGYTNESPPDVKNPAQLKELARLRDPAQFDPFKTRILRYLRNHHGELPWEGE
jgi:hypothetical protein